MLQLSYAVVTPARNEAENLGRLACCLAEQTALPSRWIIVDNGSTDSTLAIAQDLEREHRWVRVLRVLGEAEITRGAPIVRAFHAGLEAVGSEPDLVVKIDADVSMEPDFFERLLDAFAIEPTLGIAGGTCYEWSHGRWSPQRVTRSHVRGATRAYRWACLQDVLPLEERIGWDGIDELKARARGWGTASLPDLRFHHHRALGRRENAFRVWLAQGEMAHYMWYRPSYVVLRSLFRSRRNPAAVAMIGGYIAAALRRRRRLDDESAVAHLRHEQSLRRLPQRIREAIGRQASSEERA
ncbi:MAG TPA: glycosyltransferase [Gaiellaceae bacterium]|jgi:glycosyltransferase involved in cell wall biosynthesis|nr:glycosyltransferase [Gaiellaceae bacterium]